MDNTEIEFPTPTPSLADKLAGLNHSRNHYWQERQRLVRQGAKIGLIHGAGRISDEARQQMVEVFFANLPTIIAALRQQETNNG